MDNFQSKHELLVRCRTEYLPVSEGNHPTVEIKIHRESLYHHLYVEMDMQMDRPVPIFRQHIKTPITGDSIHIPVEMLLEHGPDGDNVFLRSKFLSVVSDIPNIPELDRDELAQRLVRELGEKIYNKVDVGRSLLISFHIVIVMILFPPQLTEENINDAYDKHVRWLLDVELLPLQQVPGSIPSAVSLPFVMIRDGHPALGADVEGEDKPRCQICKEKFKIESKIMELPCPCLDKWYCRECVLKSFGERTTCPICRMPCVLPCSYF